MFDSSKRSFFSVKGFFFRNTGIRHNSKFLLNALRLFWILLIFYGEILTFYFSVKNAAWPTDPAWTAKGNEGVTHISLIADPQLVDYHSYNHSGARLLLEQIFTDTYLAKSYFFVKRLKRPSKVIFLGDLLDGGREWTDLEWEKEWRRFKSIFKVSSSDRTRNRELHFMAGNHDIGIGDKLVTWAVHRHRNYVGPLNYVVPIGDHVLVVLDTIGYVNNDPMVSAESHRFLKSVVESYPQKRKILFTHVPLYRAPNTSCGPLRQKKSRSIEYAKGYQYQTLTDPENSNEILTLLKPEMVFSGDDHDNCVVDHFVEGKVIPEGVDLPSFGLLSLYTKPTNSRPSLSSKPLPRELFTSSFLPFQLQTYITYALCFVVSLFLILVDLLWVGVVKKKIDLLPTTLDSPKFLPSKKGISVIYSGGIFAKKYMNPIRTAGSWLFKFSQSVFYVAKFAAILFLLTLTAFFYI
ncbi:hypothetical protein BB560_003183 [Smittium megazygosporum]|uniref:Calcineurin-like phosphoesterase domain-containing protein n=1 Tax=Smittium megazygosporum TaxID=133381 RepID=A0A2T9ZCP5_9FUNG|nr:hypothetical protein BB560_003183 [Smittium megazygosporum]